MQINFVTRPIINYDGVYERTKNMARSVLPVAWIEEVGICAFFNEPILRFL